MSETMGRLFRFVYYDDNLFADVNMEATGVSGFSSCASQSMLKGFDILIYLNRSRVEFDHLPIVCAQHPQYLPHFAKDIPLGKLVILSVL